LRSAAQVVTCMPSSLEAALASQGNSSPTSPHAAAAAGLPLELAERLCLELVVFGVQHGG
jgi:hypothetical protein